MKKYFMVLIVGLIIFIEVYAQTNFTEIVSSLWFSGQKTNVLNIANQRLQTNTNDIAGLILKMEYEIEFVELTNLTHTIDRVLNVGSSITSTNFVQLFPALQGELNYLKTIITNYPSNELTLDRMKGNISGKPLPHTEVLKSLENDGYFE